MQLTTFKINTIHHSGRYADGHGLYLIVNHKGSKSWVFRYQFMGKRRDMGLGGYPFISLKKAIPPSLIYLKKNGILLTLIKPQFEANRESITKGGIVKDLVIHEKVCNDVITFFRVNQKLSYLSLIESSILGQKGNKEFFGIFRK